MKQLKQRRRRGRKRTLTDAERLEHRRESRRNVYARQSKGSSYIDKLVKTIENVKAKSSNPSAEFNEMFSEKDKVNLIEVVLPEVIRGCQYSGNASYYDVDAKLSEAKVDEIYEVVTSHLKKIGSWDKTVHAKFPPDAIKEAIRRILACFDLNLKDSSVFDWGVEFEVLREHENVDDFLNELTRPMDLEGTGRKIPKDYEPLAIAGCYAELDEKASILGMVAITKREHKELLRCEQALKESKIKIIAPS